MEVWLVLDAELTGDADWPCDRDEWLVALTQQLRFPPEVRHVGAALAGRATRAGSVSRDRAPRLGRLAGEAGVAIGDAEAAVERLKREGWLLVERWPGHDWAYQLTPRVLRPSAAVQLF